MYPGDTASSISGINLYGSGRTYNFHDSAARSNSLCALYEHGLLFFLVLVQTIRPSLLSKFYDSFVLLLSRYVYFARTLLTFIPYFSIKAFQFFNLRFNVSR